MLGSRILSGGALSSGMPRAINTLPIAAYSVSEPVYLCQVVRVSHRLSGFSADLLRALKSGCQFQRFPFLTTRCSPRSLPAATGSVKSPVRPANFEEASSIKFSAQRDLWSWRDRCFTGGTEHADGHLPATVPGRMTETNDLIHALVVAPGLGSGDSGRPVAGVLADDLEILIDDEMARRCTS